MSSPTVIHLFEENSTNGRYISDARPLSPMGRLQFWIHRIQETLTADFSNLELDLSQEDIDSDLYYGRD